MSKKILVTGATGTLGSEVVKALKKSGAAFKAGVRDAAKATQKFGAGVELVEFDFANPSTYAAATEDVDRVFLLGPPLNYEMDKLLAPFIDHLNAQSIKRVAYLSAYKSETIAHGLKVHKVLEEKLHALNFQVTTLKPSFFAQNFKNYEWDNITKYKIVYSPSGDGKVAFVDIRDVAEVAAKVLTESGHEGKTYELTGPETLSMSDVANILTEIRGEKIVYPNPTPEQYAQTLKQAGAPDFIAPYMTLVYSMISNGHVNHVTPDAERLLGRKPGSLRKVLEESFSEVTAYFKP